MMDGGLLRLIYGASVPYYPKHHALAHALLRRRSKNAFDIVGSVKARGPPTHQPTSRENLRFVVRRK